MGRCATTRHVVDTDALIASVRAVKKVRGVRWADVAEEMGMSRAGVLALVEGAHAPSGHTLLTIMMWLGVTDISPYVARRDGASVQFPGVRAPRTRSRTRHTSSSWSVEQIMTAFHDMVRERDGS